MTNPSKIIDEADAAHVRAYTEEAARWMFRSIECDSSMLAP